MYLSDQIIRVLDDICSKFGVAIDWTSENVIPYITVLCTKLISYEIWTSVAWLVISLITVVVILVLFIKNRSRLDDTFGAEMFWLLFILFSVIFGAMSISGIIGQIMDIIKCVTFPEMYIVEYVGNLIKGMT